MSWTRKADSEELSLEALSIASDGVQAGVYTSSSSGECHVIATSDDLQTNNIWFTTPALDEHTIKRMHDLQLFTVAHYQPVTDDDVLFGNWAWFDIVVLDTPESRVAATDNDGHRALVWRSHDVESASNDGVEQAGKVFEFDQDVFKHLKPGNAIGVRACVRFGGWELHGLSARLVVTVQHQPPVRPKLKRHYVQLPSHGKHGWGTGDEVEETNGSHSVPVDWAEVATSNQELHKAIEMFLDNATGPDAPPARSPVTVFLTQELRADSDHGAGRRPLRLLSLDGGGVRGISSLHVLKDVMGKIAGDRNAKPCDYFDMMAGTSTGGLIAIMLGRLKMTIDECIAAYNEFAKEVFDINDTTKIWNFRNTGARYSGETLEKTVKTLVARYAPSKNPDEPMLDPDPTACKVFVLACKSVNINNQLATHLASYSVDDADCKSTAPHASNLKIWEAARATSAAPTYFPSMKLSDKCSFVDGGVGFNNPVLLLMGEARTYFGSARTIESLVTIGTGMNPNIELPPAGNGFVQNIAGAFEAIKAMWELTSSSEIANQYAQNFMSDTVYYRFNVGKKVIISCPKSIGEHLGESVNGDSWDEDNWCKIAIALDDWKLMDGYGKLTDEFMQEEEQAERAAQVAKKLPPKRQPLPIVRLTPFFAFLRRLYTHYLCGIHPRFSTTKTIIIILNGFPGTGKYTILKEVKTVLHGNHKAPLLLDNHTSSILQPHSTPAEAQTITFCDEISARRCLHQKGHIVLMTACLAKCPSDAAVMQEHLDLVRGTGVPLYWINAHCGVATLLERAQSSERMLSGKTKLTDTRILQSIVDEHTLIAPEELGDDPSTKVIVKSLYTNGEVNEAVDRLLTIVGLARRIELEEDND